MPLSPLRLRLAAGFALAFGAGLALLAALALGYLWRESHRRLDARLDGVARGVLRAVARELRETPDSSLAYVGAEVAKEWPRTSDAWVIVDARGTRRATTDPGDDKRRVLAGRSVGVDGHFDVTGGGPDLRVVPADGLLPRRGGPDEPFRVLAWGSTEGIEGDTELLATALALASPLIIIASLVAGYVLAGGVLRPVGELGAAMAAVGADDLSHRLPAPAGRDELAVLALEFNRLLERLDAAQRRNRGFVRDAAHQIRTPLTLVLGEAAHELAARESSTQRMRATLQRIGTAAEQMRRRVDELFLLAEAEAGAHIELGDDVELDGLALECTELMRARAMALGRTLALGTIEPVAVRGNEALLREALLELLENGCRHGGDGAPVTTEVAASDGEVTVRVRNALAQEGAEAQARDGLGLPIVGWIARGHGGRLESVREPGAHVARIVLPLDRLP